MKQTIAIEKIIIDKKFQARVKGLDAEHVENLKEEYERADCEIELPRVWTIKGRDGFVLTRGFHRLEALNQLGRKRVECEVRSGTYSDALTDAAKSNHGHGKPRTNADKRRELEMLIEANPEWSNRTLAEEARVSHSMVNDVRVQLEESSSSEKPMSRVGLDGKSRSVRQPPPKTDKATETASNDVFIPKSSSKNDNKLEEVPQNIPGEPVGKLETYYRNDGIPDMPGVYRPRMMKSSGGTEVVLDGNGNPAPSAVGDTFADPTIRDILAQAISGAEMLDSVYSQFIELKAGRKPFHQYPWLDIPTIQKLANTIRDTSVKLCDELRGGIPYAVCPACSGERKGCKECKLSGYWPKSECDVYPQRFRKTGEAA